MVITAIWHGLGNQLFQYAMGRALSLKRGDHLWLDRSWYHPVPVGDTLRAFRLHRFRIHARYLANLMGDVLFPRKKYQKITAGIRSLVPRVEDWAPDFKVAFAAAPRVCYFKGYWQDEIFFKEIERVIRDDFTLRDPLSSARLDLQRRLRDEGYVSLHVRRGDYTSNHISAAFHGLVPLDWYARAMDIMRERLGACRFAVFSDDIDWARANFATPGTLFIGNSGDGRDEEDLYLMAACRAHIIANSSFSWWGAGSIPIPPSLLSRPRVGRLKNTTAPDVIRKAGSFWIDGFAGAVDAPGDNKSIMSPGSPLPLTPPFAAPAKQLWTAFAGVVKRVALGSGGPVHV